jgi:hydrogenase maturation protease
MGLADVRVLTSTGEPGELLDAWDGVPLAVVVDAAVGDGAVPGRVRRWVCDDEPAASVSSHSLGLPATYALGQALGRVPEELVVLTVDVADATLGPGLSAPVAAAVRDAVDAVLDEFGVTDRRDLRPATED